ncbi:hypothetical protein C8R44DRAFT_787042 [Mycena epipterygia]|nr:hypothetical protein C8R44DRAFT_787042 [Mycena epipterygia]
MGCCLLLILCSYWYRQLLDCRGHDGGFLGAMEIRIDPIELFRFKSTRLRWLSVGCRVPTTRSRFNHSAHRAEFNLSRLCIGMHDSPQQNQSCQTYVTRATKKNMKHSACSWSGPARARIRRLIVTRYGWLSKLL